MVAVLHCSYVFIHGFTIGLKTYIGDGFKFNSAYDYIFSLAYNCLKNSDCVLFFVYAGL